MVQFMLVGAAADEAPARALLSAMGDTQGLWVPIDALDPEATQFGVHLPVVFYWTQTIAKHELLSQKMTGLAENAMSQTIIAYSEGATLNPSMTKAGLNTTRLNGQAEADAAALKVSFKAMTAKAGAKQITQRVMSGRGAGGLQRVGLIVALIAVAGTLVAGAGAAAYLVLQTPEPGPAAAAAAAPQTMPAPQASTPVPTGATGLASDVNAPQPAPASPSKAAVRTGVSASQAESDAAPKPLTPASGLKGSQDAPTEASALPERPGAPVPAP